LTWRAYIKVYKLIHIYVYNIVQGHPLFAEHLISTTRSTGRDGSTLRSTLCNYAILTFAIFSLPRDASPTFHTALRPNRGDILFNPFDVTGKSATAIQTEPAAQHNDGLKFFFNANAFGTYIDENIRMCFQNVTDFLLS